MIKRTFLNFFYKIFLFPGVLYFLWIAFPGQLSFSSVKHWLDVSFVLIIIGLIADEVVLGMYGIHSATLQGAVAIGGIVYLSGWLFSGSHITIWGGILAGASLGIVEFIMHRYIRKDQKNHKAHHP
jgi:hypothetical protein